MAEASRAARARGHAVLGWLIAALGAVLVVGGILAFRPADDAEDVTDLVRAELSDEGLAVHRTDFDTAQAVIAGLDTAVLPAVAAELGLTPEQFEAELRAAYPALGALLTQQADIASRAERSLVNLERQRARFARADELPAGSIPLTAAPVALVVAGLVVIAAGVTVALARRRRLAMGASVTCLVVCLGIVFATFATGAPARAADGTAVLDSLDPSQAVVDRTAADLATVRAAYTELLKRVIPDLGERLGTGTLGVFTTVTAASPEVASQLLALPEVLDRYETRVDIRVQGAPALRSLRGFPLELLVWAFVAVAATIAVLAGVALLREGRVDHQPPTSAT